MWLEGNDVNYQWGGPAPSDLSCDILLSVTHLFYRIVVKTFGSKYNLVLIRLVHFLESEELAEDDETTPF
jgi:hypothetical protein